MAKKKPGLCTTVEDDGPDGSNNTALARRAVRRRRGSLQSFPSMPLDIFHEVNVCLPILPRYTHLLFVGLRSFESYGSP